MNITVGRDICNKKVLGVASPSRKLENYIIQTFIVKIDAM